MTTEGVQAAPEIRAIPCPECGGSGEPYDGVQYSECEGTGKVPAEVEPITLEDLGETCRDCCGSGFAGHPDSNVKCARCNGSGDVRSMTEGVKRDALLALEKRVEEAEEGSRELDREIAKAAGFTISSFIVPDEHPIFKAGSGLEFIELDGKQAAIPPFSGSIDAALALVSRVLPTLEFNLRRHCDGQWQFGVFIIPEAQLPLFIIAALLRSLTKGDAR